MSMFDLVTALATSGAIPLRGMAIAIYTIVKRVPAFTLTPQFIEGTRTLYL